MSNKSAITQLRSELRDVMEELEWALDNTKDEWDEHEIVNRMQSSITNLQMLIDKAHKISDMDEEDG